MAIASLIIIVSFFLPYVTILGTGAAGYQLHEVWKLGIYLWSIPALAAIGAIAASLSKGGPNLARLIGIVPFAFLAVALFQGGKDVLSALSIGGYSTLISAGFLIWYSPRFVPKSSAPAPARST